MKIIVSDYDCTLKTGDRIEDNLKQAIINFRNKGNLFVIATGRSYTSISNELKAQGINEWIDYIISSNGAMITDANQKVMFEKYIEPKTAYSLIEYAERHFDFFTCSNGRHVYGKFELDTNEAHMHHQRHQKHLISKEDILKTPIISLNVRAKNAEELLRQKEEVMAHFENRVSCFKNLTIFDIMAKDISKATGINEVLKYYPSDEVYVIGDDFNDIDMVQQFHGYAMSHGVEALKEVASKEYDSVYDLLIEHTK